MRQRLATSHFFFTYFGCVDPASQNSMTQRLVTSHFFFTYFGCVPPTAVFPQLLLSVFYVHAPIFLPIVCLAEFHKVQCMIESTT